MSHQPSLQALLSMCCWWVCCDLWRSFS